MITADTCRRPGGVHRRVAGDRIDLRRPIRYAVLRAEVSVCYHTGSPDVLASDSVRESECVLTHSCYRVLSMSPTAKRATPLPPAERREAIVSAVLPFLVQQGTSVTSRDLARAAGVAEGTIFKVFPDKDDLFAAVHGSSHRSRAGRTGIEALDPDVPFEERLVVAAVFMQRRLLDIWSLFGSIGASVIPPDQRRMPDSAALTALFAGDSDLVRIRPPIAARRFRSLVLAFSHPDPQRSSPAGRRISSSFFLARRRSRIREASSACCAPTSTRYRWPSSSLVRLPGAADHGHPAAAGHLERPLDRRRRARRRPRHDLAARRRSCWSCRSCRWSSPPVRCGSARDVAMGFGREVVARSLPARQSEFSAREVSHFGAPSLITRITNDVQQVQLLLVMVATMMIAAPLDDGDRHHPGHPRGRWAVDDPARGHSARDHRARVHHRADGPCRSSRCRARIDRVNTVLREQIAGVRVVRAFTREPEESRPLRHGQPTSSPRCRCAPLA